MKFKISEALRQLEQCQTEDPAEKAELEKWRSLLTFLKDVGAGDDVEIEISFREEYVDDDDTQDAAAGGPVSGSGSAYER
ncbi:MAG: hypothetical protein IJ233_11575 [Pyramidobacter sp.]|nr:hypothetical protein [Pyramidobacter sp.]